jgi:hypothetical protein
LEITAVKTTRRTEPHLCISHVGGKFTTGKPWKTHIAEVVTNIETGRHTFYIMRGIERVDVVVAVYKGNKYLKTAKDGERPEQLLALGSPTF